MRIAVVARLRLGIVGAIILTEAAMFGCDGNRSGDSRNDGSMEETNAALARITAGGHQDPVKLNGVRNEKTHPFNLIAGTYVVRWRAHNEDGPGNCAFYGYVNSVDGNYKSEAGDATVHTVGNGSTYLYGVPDGRFFFEAVSGCVWSVTISRE
jgi:hypothetical protein